MLLVLVLCVTIPVAVYRKYKSGILPISSSSGKYNHYLQAILIIVDYFTGRSARENPYAPVHVSGFFLPYTYNEFNVHTMYSTNLVQMVSRSSLMIWSVIIANSNVIIEHYNELLCKLFYSHNKELFKQITFPITLVKT